MSSNGDDLRFRLTRCDSQIRIEFDLIGYRMTWLMTSQSFLFTAFTVCVNALQPHMIAKWLQFVIPLVGLISACLVALSIRAAHRVIEKLKPARAALEKTASPKFEALGVDVGSRDHADGNLPSRVLPWVLFSAWLLLLILVAYQYT